MALVACSECNNQISTEAAACPSCGAPTAKEGAAKKQGSIVLGASAIGCGAAAIFLPYFASVFFTPCAIVLALLSLMKKQVLAGVFALVLGGFGVAGIIHTSNQISDAQENMRQTMQKAQADMEAAQADVAKSMAQVQKEK